MYHNRLAQLIAIKKGEQYAKTISWIRTRTSFALLRSALFVLEALEQEECYATLRMVILTSKLLKEPFNWTIDCFLTFKWQIFVNNALRTLLNFPLFF